MPELPNNDLDIRPIQARPKIEDSVLIDHAEEINNVLDSIPNESGLTFLILKNGLGIAPKPDMSVHGDKFNDLVDITSQEYFGMPSSDLDDTQLTLIRKIVAVQGLGGYEVTDRDLNQIKSYLPDVFSHLQSGNVNKKVTFLGNGLSSAPLELLSENPNLNIVINDVFDYGLAKDYLAKVNEKLTEMNIPVYGTSLEKIKKLCENISASEQIETVRYQLRTDDQIKKDIPSQLHDSDVIINVFGPPLKSLSEQMSMLSEHGQLWVIGYDLPSQPTMVPGYSYETLGEGKFVITKRDRFNNG